MISLDQTTDTLNLKLEPATDADTNEMLGYLIAEVESEVSVGHYVTNASGKWRVGPGDPTSSVDLSISLDDFRRYVHELQTLLTAVETLEAA